jgi:hypothetical protein
MTTRSRNEERNVDPPAAVSSASSLDTFLLESYEAMSSLDNATDRISPLQNDPEVEVTEESHLISNSLLAECSVTGNSVPEFLYQLTKMLTEDNRDIIEWSNGTSRMWLIVLGTNLDRGMFF